MYRNIDIESNFDSKAEDKWSGQAGGGYPQQPGEEDEREEREKEEYEGEEDGLEFNQHRSFSLILRYLQHISCSAIFLSNFQVLGGTQSTQFQVFTVLIDWAGE